MHKRGTSLKFAVLRIHMLHQLQLVGMYMHEGHMENKQQLYFYDNVIKLDEINIEYWM